MRHNRLHLVETIAKYVVYFPPQKGIAKEQQQVLIHYSHAKIMLLDTLGQISSLMELNLKAWELIKKTCKSHDNLR